MSELAILIPSRNEEWLGRTVADVLEHSRADTEVIAVLDGAWPIEPLPQHPKLTVVYVPESIGQRACTNLAARLTHAPYIAKLDAHCSVAEGFDRVLLDSATTLGPDVVQVPAQKNLHAYDWVCGACGRREYQCGLMECRACGSPDLKRDMVWKPKKGVTTTRWAFDHDLRFQYWNGGPSGDITETMSCIGACWFQSREQFLAWGGLDEGHGSWGQVGTELGCKAWLSGGRLVTNHQTWFAHFFRVGGHQIPYPLTGNQQEAARVYSRDLWLQNKWPLQKYPLKWLVEKFQPAGWTQEQIDGLSDTRAGVHGGVLDGGTPVPMVAAKAIDPPSPAPMLVETPHGTKSARAILYYSDNRLDTRVARAAQVSLERIGLPILAVTLSPFNWLAARNVVLPLERGYLSMFRQILVGLELLDADYVFFAEHDVLYHATHFSEVPVSESLIYNEHVYKVSADDGRALHYRCAQTSGLSGPRKLLLEHYRKRVDLVQEKGFSRGMGFEPATHGRPERVDDLKADHWMSSVPNLDIRHGQNLTKTRWKQDQFRNKKYTAGWTESDSVPGWGTTAGRFQNFLDEVMGYAALQAVS